MSLILDYIQKMFIYCMFFIPFYVLIRIIYIKKKSIKPSFKIEFLFGTLAVYLIGLLSQTIVPIWHLTYSDLDRKFHFMFYFQHDKHINIIPFHTIFQYLFTFNNNVDNWDKVSSMNLLANVGLFLPIGILLPLVFKNNSIIKTLLSGVVISFIIEFIQYFIGRSSDIDDIILNTVGTMIGYVIFIIINKLLRTNHHLKN